MAYPTWRAGVAADTWIELPNTRIDAAAGWENGIFAFGGGGPGKNGWYGFGGGHADSGSNAVYYIDLSVNTPAWARLRATTTPQTPEEASHYGDGRPTAAHSYQVVYECFARSRLMRYTANSVTGSIGSTKFDTVDAFRPSSLGGDDDFDAAATFANAPTGSSVLSGAACKATDDSEDFYIVGGSNNKLQRWNQSANSWGELGTDVVQTNNIDACAAMDPGLRRIVLFQDNPSARYALSNGVETPFNFSGAISAGFATWGWDPNKQKFLGKPWGGGNTFYQCDRNNFVISVLSTTGGTPPAVPAGQEINLRFAYIRGLGGWIYIASWDVNVWFLATEQALARTIPVTRPRSFAPGLGR